MQSPENMVTQMLQPASIITEVCSATENFWKENLKAELHCFQCLSESLSAQYRPVLLTLKQVSRSCLGRHRTCHSSETCPWTSRPGTSLWPGTSPLCAAPARRSSGACRHTGLGNWGKRSHRERAQDDITTCPAPTPAPQSRKRPEALFRSCG